MALAKLRRTIFPCGSKVSRVAQEVALEPSPPRPAAGSMNPIQPREAWVGFVQKPVRTQMVERGRRGGFSVDNPGQVATFSSDLSINDRKICSLQDVFDAVLRTTVDPKQRGSVKLANVQTKIRHVATQTSEKSLVAIISGDPTNRNYIDYGKQSSFEEDIDSWELIAALSALCTNPMLMRVIRANLVSSICEDDQEPFKSTKKDPLLFTFALRNVLARLAFHTKLTNVVCYALINHMESKKYRLADGVGSLVATFAFVGFNRLLSPNNDTGVSYSSDIDYKLVVDTSLIKQRDSGTGYLVDLSNAQVQDLIEALNEAQKKEEVKGQFDSDAKLLLEVKQFTTRSLSELETMVATNEQEKNFLASIYNNNIHIAGSGKVYHKFTELLQDHEADLDIAKRTWTQYLGPSDKGSVMWISKTEDIEWIVKIAVANIVNSNLNMPNLAYTAIEKLGNVNGALKGLTEVISSSDQEGMMKWFESPHIFKALLSNNDIFMLLEGDDTIKQRLAGLNMFPNNNTVGPNLKFMAKVYADLVDDGVFDPELAQENLLHIGSRAHRGATWRFSLKYAGCRLNDFYDSVTLEDYIRWVGENGEETYEFGKLVGSAINEFALRMQNYIYLLASVPDDSLPNMVPDVNIEGLKHKDIDSLYANMTNHYFSNMPIRSVTGNIAGDLRLESALARLQKKLEPARENEFVKAVLDETNKLLTKFKRSDLGVFEGYPFFSSLFDLSFHTANRLKRGGN